MHARYIHVYVMKWKKKSHCSPIMEFLVSKEIATREEKTIK